MLQCFKKIASSSWPDCTNFHISLHIHRRGAQQKLQQYSSSSPCPTIPRAFSILKSKVIEFKGTCIATANLGKCLKSRNFTKQYSLHSSMHSSCNTLRLKCECRCMRHKAYKPFHWNLQGCFPSYPPEETAKHLDLWTRQIWSSVTIESDSPMNPVWKAKIWGRIRSTAKLLKAGKEHTKQVIGSKMHCQTLGREEKNSLEEWLYPLLNGTTANHFVLGE